MIISLQSYSIFQEEEEKEKGKEPVLS